MEHYQKFRDLKREHHIFSYTGPLGFEDVISLHQLIEKILIIQKTDVRQKRRIVNIIIEGLQNIQLHGAKGAENNSVGKDCLFMLGKKQDVFFLVLGNFITSDIIDVLKAKLEELNHMDMAHIKALYMEILEKDEINSKGGASLGLVKMFMDSNKNFKFNFHKVDDQYSFFTFELNIPEK